jgi:PAS domain S-box-containing protein
MRWCCATPNSAWSTSIPAYEALSGNRREDVLGSMELTLRVPERNSDRREVHQRALAGESVRLETEALRKDGTRFLIEVHVVPMAYKGKPTCSTSAATSPAARRRRSACAPARSSTGPSSTPSTRRWCCATRVSGSSTSTAPTWR